MTVSVLFGVAALQAVAGALYGLFYGNRPDFAWREWIYVFSAPIYLMLGFTARRFSAASLLAGFAVQSFLLVYLDSLPSPKPEVLANGLILEIPICVLFMCALWVEANHEQVRKGLPPLEFKALVKVLPYILGSTVAVLTLLYCLVDFNFQLRMLGSIAPLKSHSEKPFEQTLEYSMISRI